MIPANSLTARAGRCLPVLLLAMIALGQGGCSQRGKLPLEHPIVMVYQKPVDLRKLGSDYPQGFILGGGGIYSTFSSFSGILPEVFQPAGSYLVRLDPDGTVQPLTPVLGAAVRDPEVSHDGKKIVFSMKSGAAGSWQIHEVDADGKDLRRISRDESYNDFDPVHLPDGGIVFLSDRPRLLDPIFHQPSAQLHIMRPDGTGVVQFSVDPGGEFNPTVSSDGHLLFTQWNSHYKNHDPASYEVRPGVFLALDRFLVWKTALDGTSNAHPFFGDHLIDDFTGGLLHVREIPDGSGKLLGALVDARGTYGSGTLVRLDPSRNAGEQKIEYVTPNVHLTLDATVQGRYRSPYPLQNGNILAVYGEGPLLEATSIPPAGPPGVVEGTDGRARSLPLRPIQAPPPRFKLVLLPASGGQRPAVVHEHPDFWMFSPVELAPRPRPTMNPGTAKRGIPYGVLNALDVELRDRNLDDVRNGDEQVVPRPGEVARVQFFVADSVPVSLPGSTAVHKKIRERLIGEAPVEADGSFAVVVPADVPLFWRTVRTDGSSVVEDPFLSQVRPGQVITCNGCHSPHDGTPGRTTNLALSRPVNLSGQDVDRNGNGVVDLLED